MEPRRVERSGAVFPGGEEVVPPVYGDGCLEVRRAFGDASDRHIRLDTHRVGDPLADCAEAVDAHMEHGCGFLVIGCIPCD
jgi:hypothetical protein